MSSSPQDPYEPMVGANCPAAYDDEYTIFKWSLQSDAQRSIHDLDFSVQDYINNHDDEAAPETKRARLESMEDKNHYVVIQNKPEEAMISATIGLEEGLHGGNSNEGNEGREWESAFKETFRQVGRVVSYRINCANVRIRTNVGAPANWR